MSRNRTCALLIARHIKTLALIYRRELPWFMLRVSRVSHARVLQFVTCKPLTMNPKRVRIFLALRK